MQQGIHLELTTHSSDILAVCHWHIAGSRRQYAYLSPDVVDDVHVSRTYVISTIYGVEGWQMLALHTCSNNTREALTEAFVFRHF